MKSVLAVICVIAFHSLLSCGTAQAVTYGYTENFTSNDAGWRGLATTQLLDHHLTGGVDDGGYVDIAPANDPQAGSLMSTNGAVLFRANSTASGGAFVGPWLNSGVSKVQAYVRHDLEESPINYFVRLPGAPGQAGVFFADSPVDADDDWTLVNFEISPANFTVAGGPGTTFTSVLSNVSNFQIGGQISGSPAPTALIHFELDQVSLVPEPASIVVAMGAALAGLAFRRRRSRR
jgi:hypothetical protein